MKACMKNRKPLAFLLLVLIFFVAADFMLEQVFDDYIISSGNFRLNDYEVTRRDHPEAVWDKVFYGNSSVISSYREDLSGSDYINFGVDYGSMTDLRTILRSNKVEIDSELVIGINWAAMCDNMETNPNYFWNRKVLEPYCYFQRDRLYAAIEGKLSSFATGVPWADGSNRTQTKSYYFSSLSDEELQGKIAVYEERYWSAGIEGCANNLEALADVMKFCREQNIHLRVVNMPWNPVLEKPEVVQQLDAEIAALCGMYEVEFLDLSESFSADCFHDLGHLNYEYGSHVFTEVIDPWLIGSIE